MEYTVDAWDSLYSIAQRYGISVEELAKYNGISEDEPLQYGQVLKIPSTTKDYLTVSDEEFKEPVTRQVIKTAAEQPQYSHNRHNSKDQPRYGKVTNARGDEKFSGNLMGIIEFVGDPRNAAPDIDFSDEYDETTLGGTAQRTFLLPTGRVGQDFVFRRDGYFPVKVDLNSKQPYGLVTDRTLELGKKRDEVIPMYQRNENVISRDKIKPIANLYLNSDDPKQIFGEMDPFNTASHPGAIYVDPETNLLYYNSWDLNNYGSEEGYGSRYNWFQKGAANILDRIGLPVVVTSGIQPLTFGLGTQLTLDQFVDDTYYDGKVYDYSESEPLAREFIISDYF